MLSEIVEFKREHRIHYWLRLILGIVIIFQMIQIVSGDTPAGGEQELNSDTGVTGWGEDSASYCRQMNGTLWYFSVWRDPGDATNRVLYGWFSRDNGTSWNKIKITEDDDPGYEAAGYPVKMIDAVALTNNSIIIGLYDLDYWGSSGKQEFTFLCHWNNSDLSQWERVNGYANPTYSCTNAGMAVNGSDKISYAHRIYSHTYSYAKTFDPVTRTTATLWSKNVGVNPDVKWWVFWNFTNWNYVYSTTYGSTFVRCYDETGTQIWQQGLVASNVARDVVLSKNRIYAILDEDIGSNWGKIIFRNNNGSISDSCTFTTDSYWQQGQLGISNMDGDRFFVISYNTNTDKFSWFSGDYDSSDAYWQGTESNLFDESDDTIDRVSFLPDKLYPYNIDGSGNHTQLIHSLGGPAWAFWEYDSGDTNYNGWVELDNVTWPGILGWTYTPGAGPGPGPGGDEGDELGSGICRSSWIVFGVIMIVIIGTLGVIFEKFL